jgi:hypothetical protein
MGVPGVGGALWQLWHCDASNCETSHGNPLNAAEPPLPPTPLDPAWPPTPTDGLTTESDGTEPSPV